MYSHKKKAMTNEMNFCNGKESKYSSSDFRNRHFQKSWQKHFINKYVDTIFSVNIEYAQSTMSDDKSEHLPEYLYKFFPPTIYSLINLQNNQVFLSSPRNFNDPFDSYACIEKETYIKLFLLKNLKTNNLITKDATPETLSEEEYWKVFYSGTKNERHNSNIIYPYRKSFQSAIIGICKSKSETLQDLIRSLKVQANYECSKKVGYIRNIPFKVTCFSNFDDDIELGDNTAMWSHYADKHQGFCVKYSTNFDNMKFREIIICGLYQVDYTSRVPKISPRELMKLKFLGEKLELTKAIWKTALKALITKSKFWSYEKEWRLIISNDNAQFLSYDTIPFFKIESIYMGCRIEKGLRTSLVNFAELNGITIFQGIKSDESFELDFQEVTSKGIKNREFYDKLRKCNKITNEDKRSEYVVKLLKAFDE